MNILMEYQSICKRKIQCALPEFNHLSHFCAWGVFLEQSLLDFIRVRVNVLR